MKSFLSNSVKYKSLSKDELIICLDRLSRFKLPDESFPAVFNYILIKSLIEPKLSKKEIENLDAKTVSNFVKIIWNKSVNNVYGDNCPQSEDKPLKALISFCFKNFDKRTQTFINTDLNIRPIINNLNEKTVSLNLKFLMYADKYKQIKDTAVLREKFFLKFPVRKLVIVEGITEEILLPAFAKKLNHNFDKEGIFILGAGGKSKSPSLYLKLKDKLKIPVVILFDSDAKEIFDLLGNNLLKKDSAIIIKKGEFEDIISLNLIKRSLNNEYKPASPVIKSDLTSQTRMCKNIENIYRTRKFGEFKKSKFAKIVASNIKYHSDITPEITDLINKII